MANPKVEATWGRNNQSAGKQHSAQAKLLTRLELAALASLDGLWDAWIVPEDPFNPQNEVYFSPQFKELLGYEEDELDNILETWSSRIHPDDVETVFQAIRDHLEFKIPYKNIEYRLRTKSDRYIWVTARGQATWDATGKPLRFVGCVCDISDRKALEVELQRRDELFNGFFFTAPVGCCIVDAQRNILQVNESFVQSKGVPLEHYLGKNISEVWPELAIQHTSIWQQVLVEGRSFFNLEFEHSLVWDGETIQCWTLSYFPIFGSSDRPIAMGMTLSDRSDRQRVEAELQHHSHLLHSVIESTPDIIFVKDLEGRFVLVNSAVARLFGKSVAELTGKTDRELWLPEVADCIREADRTLMASNKTQTLEELVFDEGTVRTYLTTKSPWRDAEGNAMGLIGISRDISDRKRTEAELRQREQFLRSIYDGVEQCIIVIDVDSEGEFRYAAINPVGERLSGISEEQLRGKMPEELLGEEAGAKIRQNYVNCLRSQSSIIYEEYLEAGNTGGNWWLTTLTPLRDHHSRISQIIATSTLITELKRAEEEVRQQAQREALLNRLSAQIRQSLEVDTILATAVQEIRTLLQIDRCLFTWYLPDENPPAWEIVHEAKNPELPTLLGYYPASLTGSLTPTLFSNQIFQADDISTIIDPIARKFFQTLDCTAVLKLPVNPLNGAIGVLGCIHNQGVRSWSESEIELLKVVCDQLAIALFQAELYLQATESAAHAQAQAAQLEVTLRELKQTQAQLVQSEKMSSLGQLVAGVAHEINNPVNFIYGNLIHAQDYVESLIKLVDLYKIEYPNPTPKIAEAVVETDLEFLVADLPKLLSSMQVGAVRICEIVQSLRTFSRLDEAEKKAVNIHEGIDSTLLILHNRIKAKPDRPMIQVLKEYGNLPLVECYAGQLNQVFMNILTNAFDALEEEMTKLPLETLQTNPKTIRIKTSIRDEKTVMISVSDNGPGIPRKVIPRLFDPFFTTKPIGKGTGLGLAISYQIVEKHGGQLICNSTHGGGTEFAISIPIHASPV